MDCLYNCSSKRGEVNDHADIRADRKDEVNNGQSCKQFSVNARFQDRRLEFRVRINGEEQDQDKIKNQGPTLRSEES